MDGVHDLGGKQGHGPVEVEQHEPVFHADWERRVWGLTTGTFVAGMWNGGRFRHTIERMDPVHYLTSRYYEHWLTAVATGLVERGDVTVEELEARAGGHVPLSRPVVAVEGEQPSGADRQLAVGDRVRVRQWSPRGHTRCPQYVRGRTGVVVRVDAPASVPDVEAHTDERRREPMCCVRFDAAELWGTGVAGDAVHVDLWASYLEDA